MICDSDQNILQCVKLYLMSLELSGCISLMIHVFGVNLLKCLSHGMWLPSKYSSVCSGADIQNNRAFLRTSMKFGLIILYIHTNNFRYGATLKSFLYGSGSHFQNGRFIMPWYTFFFELPHKMKMLIVLWLENSISFCIFVKLKD